MTGLVSTFLISVVRIYQLAVSPLLPNRCRFYPSCSAYMIDAITIKGPLRGFALGIARLAKCHPFHPGGYDPVK